MSEIKFDVVAKYIHLSGQVEEGSINQTSGEDQWHDNQWKVWRETNECRFLCYTPLIRPPRTTLPVQVFNGAQFVTTEESDQRKSWRRSNLAGASKVIRLLNYEQFDFGLPGETRYKCKTDIGSEKFRVMKFWVKQCRWKFVELEGGIF